MYALLTDSAKCYRSSNPGLAVRVYLMIYRSSCEEQKLLLGIRREKEAFVRLIKERSVSSSRKSDWIALIGNELRRLWLLLLRKIIAQFRRERV